MSFTPFGITLGILLVVLLVYQHRMFSKDVDRFYEELEIGDVYDYISDGNVFIQPVEVLTIIDKKCGYIKYTVLIRKTGEIREKSCSKRDFYDKICYFGLIKRNKMGEKQPSDNA